MTLSTKKLGGLWQLPAEPPPVKERRGRGAVIPHPQSPVPSFLVPQTCQELDLHLSYGSAHVPSWVRLALMTRRPLYCKWCLPPTTGSPSLPEPSASGLPTHPHAEVLVT